jgi:hypothetical protein
MNKKCEVCHGCETPCGKRKYKYKIGQVVRFEGRKAKIRERFWDEYSSNRYEVSLIIGKNVVKDTWSVRERSLEEY